MREGSPEYNSWRDAVLKRDKHRCRMPGCNKCKTLEIHHIFRWANNPSLRFDVGNGITLCREHHKEVTQSETYYIQLFLEIIK